MQEVLSTRETSLLLFVALNLVNFSVMSEYVLQSSRRGSVLSSFYLERSSGLKDILPKLPLLDKVFEIHVGGSVLGSPMSLGIMKKAVILRSRMGRIVLLWIQTLHSRLILDGFEDSLESKL